MIEKQQNNFLYILWLFIGFNLFCSFAYMFCSHAIASPCRHRGEVGCHLTASMLTLWLYASAYHLLNLPHFLPLKAGHKIVNCYAISMPWPLIPAKQPIPSHFVGLWHGACVTWLAISRFWPVYRADEGVGEGHPAPLRYYIHIRTQIRKMRLLTTKITVLAYMTSVRWKRPSNERYVLI